MSLIGPSIHVFCTLKRRLLALEGDKDVYDSIFKSLIMLYPLHIDKDAK